MNKLLLILTAAFFLSSCQPEEEHQDWIPGQNDSTALISQEQGVEEYYEHRLTCEFQLNLVDNSAPVFLSSTIFDENDQICGHKNMTIDTIGFGKFSINYNLHVIPSKIYCQIQQGGTAIKLNNWWKMQIYYNGNILVEKSDTTWIDNVQYSF